MDGRTVAESVAEVAEGFASERRERQQRTTLARADSSLALVASMHPAVLSYWLGAPEPTEGLRGAWSAQIAEVAESAAAGAWWGTITSEPGSGGMSPARAPRETAGTASGSSRGPSTSEAGSG